MARDQRRRVGESRSGLGLGGWEPARRPERFQPGEGSRLEDANATRFRTRLPWRHILQREIGRVVGPLWLPLAEGVLRFWMGYRIEMLSEIRAKYRLIRRESSGPILICANHLTMLDSFLVAVALAPTWRYALHYGELPWNTPERRNFASTRWKALLTYLAKCIPITRGGSPRQAAAVLGRVSQLLRNGEVALLFPEGGRSRTGRVEIEAASWGVGRIVGSLPSCRVLCVYLRGRAQRTWGRSPARGDRIHVDIECIEPKSDYRGVRRSRDFARQIVAQLARMERRHLDGGQ